MREEVLAITVAVLGFYLASLAFSFQQISDNLTYKLIQPKNPQTLWSLRGFIVLILVASWSVYCGDRDCGNTILNGDAISWIVMLLSIALMICASWSLFSSVFKFESNIDENLKKLAPGNRDDVIQSILTISLANREFGRIQNIITSTQGTSTQPAVLQWLRENLGFFSNKSLEHRITDGLLQQMSTAPSDSLLSFLEHYIFESSDQEKAEEVAIAVVEDLRTKVVPSEWDLKVLLLLLQDHPRLRDVEKVTKPLETILPKLFSASLERDAAKAQAFFKDLASQAKGYVAVRLGQLIAAVGNSNLADNQKQTALAQMVPVLAEVRHTHLSGDIRRDEQFKEIVLRAFTDMEASGLLDTATKENYCMRVTSQTHLNGY